MKTIVLATRNNNKIIEIKTLLEGLPLEIRTLNDFPQCPALIEDGNTFKENSLKKAEQVFRFTHLPTLADDSGLEVFYLNGRPGVISARYARDRASDQENNKKLLREMKGVAPRRRHAQFRAVVTLFSDAIHEQTQGICEGRLGEVPNGTNGFGYDPLFIPKGFSRTYAQLTAEEKNQISHRAKALEKMKEKLQRLL
ncbi:MAG: RdgB/HAM1 family non-canonical purine NTP pyrophosphatase [bacterium]